MASLGIVYGDIGTSPLYALRECFYGSHAVAPTQPNLLGVISLILWSLFLIISIKYLVLILRADNRGEGGILALATLVRDEISHGRIIFWVGLFGATLLYADGMITPAITVMGAIEGLNVVTPLFEPYVVPLSVGVLVGVFLFQSQGTSAVGAIFGPITMLWFLTLSAMGISQILRAPEILAAINPIYGFNFFRTNGWHGFVVLGAVFLAVTGGEALYADMGHFGAKPIRLAWFTVVLPGLMLNYFGPGAALSSPRRPRIRSIAWLHRGRFILQSFFPLRRAVIAPAGNHRGAFSLTKQAIQLGYSPRLRVIYTSAQIIGQIYVPFVNWGLMACWVGLVAGFGSSSTHLAAAYGAAITTTMPITTTPLHRRPTTLAMTCGRCASHRGVLSGDRP